MTLVNLLAIIGALALVGLAGLLIERFTNEPRRYRDGRLKPGMLDE